MSDYNNLIQQYPNLYANIVHFECGDGWYDIINSLSQEIETIITNNPSLGPIKVGQVKEKFGGLRYYLDEGGCPEIYKAIEKAEKLSLFTCEVCGQPGKMRNDGWIKTLCNIHHKG